MVIATLVSLAFDIPRLAIAPIGPHVQGALAVLTSGDYWSQIFSLMGPAMALTIVASAESLLTARSLDVLLSKRHIPIQANMDRELMAQGFGNIISGLLGGMPMTGVMVRSAANLDAGATSRSSTILHGFWIALTVLLVPALLAKIPLAALAAVLIVTGVRLLNLTHLIQAMRHDPWQSWVWPATAIAIIVTDLLMGLGIGMLCWLLMWLSGQGRRKFSKGRSVPQNSQQVDGSVPHASPAETKI